MTDLKSRIDAMRGKKVEVQVAPLLYPTPKWLVEAMVELLDVEPQHRILEPSAGTGALLHGLETCGLEYDVTAIEIDHNLVVNLRRKFDCEVIQENFLNFPPDDYYDRIIMNPPFNGGDDIRHIQHAIKFLKPKGKLVAICANGPRQQKILKPLASEWTELPHDTFKEAGTMVRTAMMLVSL